MRYPALSILLLALAACASAPAQPKVFQIKPVRPVAQLLPAALAATPPMSGGSAAQNAEQRDRAAERTGPAD